MAEAQHDHKLQDAKRPAADTISDLSTEGAFSSISPLLHRSPFNVVRLSGIIGNKATQALVARQTHVQRKDEPKPEDNDLIEINGYDMPGMLRRFHTTDAGKRSVYLARLPALADKVDVPRLTFALNVVTTLVVAGGGVPADQVEAAKDFVFFVKLNGKSMTGILTEMNAMSPGDLATRMGGLPSMAGLVDVPRFEFANTVASTKTMPVGGFGVAAQKTEAENFLFADLCRICGTVPRGQEALKTFSDHSVNRVYGTHGGGSSFGADTNTMTLDPSEDTTNGALTFVHEMHHARQFHAGQSADALRMTRTEYIRKEVGEEAEGTVRSIEAKIELEGTPIDVSGATFPLEPQYRRAYTAGMASHKRHFPTASEDELKRIGRMAGNTRVIQGFMNGEVQTSTTNESYPVFYGKIWDSAHGVTTP